MACSLVEVGDHYCWSWGFSNIWTGKTSSEWKFSLSYFIYSLEYIYTKVISFTSIPFNALIFQIPVGVYFPLLICLLSRLPLLEKRLSLPLLLQPIFLLEGFLYSWEGWGTFLISVWLFALTLPLFPAQFPVSLEHKKISSLRVDGVFYTHLVFPGFLSYIACMQ